MILPNLIARVRQVIEGESLLLAAPVVCLASVRSKREVVSVKWMLSLMALALLAQGVAAAQTKDGAAVEVKAGQTAVAEAPAHSPDIYYSTTKGPYYYHNTYELKARKLARGIANVTLCVAEIPNQMFQEAYNSSLVSGAVVGAWKGLVKGGARLAIGTWEILTFYHPGNNHYQPYIEPEVVFQEYLH